ncbi:MAG TPA: histidine kinase [Bryobacteraceae bacterium]|jgi:two-component system LytT family sensor kinase
MQADLIQYAPHLVILFVKIAVSASLASILLRFPRFQRMLMREERTLLQRVQMALVGAFIFGSGVAIRILTRPNYQAVDLGLEGAMAFGMMGGYVTGLTSGVLISLPAMIDGEFLTMPVLAAAGLLGGLLRDVAPSSESIWQITPFFDYPLYTMIRRRQNFKQPAFSLLCVVTIVAAEAMRTGVAHLWSQRAPFALYHVWNDTGWVWTDLIGIHLATLFATMVPLKIWNNNRNERKLETQQLSLNAAKLDALTRQINPHFLFNTLNSVASLIRSNPEEARKVVYKLSHILRRLLRQTGNLTPLRDEMSFIEDYLAIEMVRFGDKLRYEKATDPETLDYPVPSMLLQPIVENSIRHGLSSKVGGGVIRVTSRLEKEGRLLVTVEDDGVGIPEAKLATLFELGIGVSNVNERLKVIYGDDYKMWVDSKPGEGTRTGIELPVHQAALVAVS